MILMVAGCNRKEILQTIPWQSFIPTFSFESGEEKSDPLVLNFSTGKALNPDKSAQGNPLRMIVFYLKKNDLFEKASYHSLLENPPQEILDDLVDRQEFNLLPDQERKIPQDIDKKCRCICFVAACKVLLNCTWKKCFSFDNKPSQEWIIYINNKGLEKIESTHDS